jgi:RND family efflux transporter MFP subunit
LESTKPALRPVPAESGSDQRSTLLEQLRIDRRETQSSTARTRVGGIAGAAAVAVVGAAAAAWLLIARPVSVASGSSPASAQEQTAQPARPAAAAPSGSILDASGYVVARRQATVSSKITGRVVAVPIEEGQRIEAGDVIARLDDTNARAQVAQAAAVLGQQRASLAAAMIAFENAEPTYARHQRQFELAFISAAAFDAAKATYDNVRTALDVAARGVAVAEASLALAERTLDDTVVRAPFAGVVTVKAAQEGEMVSPMSAGGGFTRTGLGTIVDMDSLEIEVDVSENFINRVYAEQPAVITLNAYPDQQMPGRVIAIIPTADRAKATVKVRVGLEHRDARILPEMGARVAFLSGERAESRDVSSDRSSQ